MRLFRAAHWILGGLLIAAPVVAAAQSQRKQEEEAGQNQQAPVPPPRAANPAIPNRTPSPTPNPVATQPPGGSAEKETDEGRIREQEAARQGQPSAAPPPVPPPPAAGRSGAAARYSVRASGETLMLRLTPENLPDLQNLDVIQGEEFTTDVLLVNPPGKTIDTLRIVLEYNPLYINPVAINDGMLAARLARPPTAAVDRTRGVVLYEVELGQPIERLDQPLLFLRWQALKPVFFSPLVFGRDRAGKPTDLLAGGESILGEPHDDGDGTLSMTVTVIPADPAEAQNMQEDPLLYLGSNERVGGAMLRIDPPARPPRAGEEFTMNVVLDNRAYSMIDGISLLLQYDPRHVEILDDDWDNWITLGVNILDGAFRREFPFDYHMANAVYPVRGQIEYRVGTSTPKDLLGATGTFARIRARAIAPTSATAFHFLFSPRPGSRTTEVTFLGQDALGDTRVRNDGVQGAVVTILP